MEADAIAAAVRTALAAIDEVRMFGGAGFMLNGNTLVAASKRGLLGAGRQGRAVRRACASRGARAENEAAGKRRKNT
ncbi:hypothetical protein [Mesorhizobium sp. B1-1-8]|uniref:hypothetical protein n=1 Tax=Mesorhizobium sp. B1-1-8 TaxID=2589976 RepID=UPI00112C643F|nr:hypothetical protein [Mesorhizobium sp. B1-1-8]UCI07919.1 hypothetical protein FJ974_02255 [Mesorhizobium sp. B1-1-8]